ncbi:hypothetical protein LUZ60_016966 [Juncus effusus]|nr:hypothetical protein LUZ60_016966 [Juncus effusus]
METPANSKAFSAAISAVSVSQICLSAGYKSAQPSALRALSDIATHYIQSIGRLSAAIADSQNRTESNLFDLVLSLETLYSARGFSGGSNLAKPVLKSSVLKELMAFVRVFDEIPFAKSIIRKKTMRNSSLSSFAELNKEAPAHVPKWLPCFPTMPDERRREKKEVEIVNSIDDDELGRKTMEQKSEFDFVFDLDLREKRERIQFTIIGLRKKKKRRIMDLALDF